MCGRRGATTEERKGAPETLGSHRRLVQRAVKDKTRRTEGQRDANGTELSQGHICKSNCSSYRITLGLRLTSKVICKAGELQSQGQKLKISCICQNPETDKKLNNVLVTMNLSEHTPHLIQQAQLQPNPYLLPMS